MSSSKPPSPPVSRPSRKRRIVIMLLGLTALVSLYFLAAPYLPKLYFKLFKPRIDATSYASAAQSGRKLIAQPSDKQGNRLILPDIGIDTRVYEGKTISVISKDQGVWRETNTVTPDKNGNLVIAGHRFMYRATDGGRFYNLTELQNGSKIYLVWKDAVYEYEVIDFKSVLPTQVDIRNPDPSVPKKLTLYTCYPLGSTAKRFVIEARQITR